MVEDKRPVNKSNEKKEGRFIKLGFADEPDRTLKFDQWLQACFDFTSQYAVCTIVGAFQGCA